MIAAGAVVTSDILAYAIVGGVPARILRYRFEPEVVTELQELQWWELSLDMIADLNFDCIDDCIEGLK